MFEKWKARIWGRRLSRKTGQAVSVAMIKRDAGKKAAFDTWAERCAANMQPNAHSIDEVEAWLVENYQTEPVVYEGTRLQMQVAEIVQNFFPEALTTRVTPPKDQSYKEYERWSMEADKAHKEAMEIDPGALGLEIHTYRVLPGGDMDFTVMFERKSGQISMQGSCRHNNDPQKKEQMDALYERLNYEFAKMRGVTQADIDGKTPRFLGYITTMRDAGEPGFAMEPAEGNG